METAAQAQRNGGNRLFHGCFLSSSTMGYLFFLFLCLCLQCTSTSPSMSQMNNPPIPRELVWNVNSSNIHVFLSKQPVLLTFYTPYCPHCQHFEQPLQRIAAVLAKDRFAVGRCDVSIQKALGARFNVHGVPAIFLYRNGKMWNYYGPLVAESVIDFSTNLYKKEKSIDYLNSPVGPIGISKGWMIRIGAVLMRTIPYLTTQLGLPDWAGYILIILIVTGTILVGTFIGVYISIVHEKVD